jgi:hypothetical protein
MCLGYLELRTKTGRDRGAQTGFGGESHPLEGPQ